jgi:hypothetical protein
VGTKYTADFVLQQLEILPSRQVRSVREYSVSYQDLTAGNGAAGSTGASSNGGTPAGGTSDSNAANAVNATAGAVKAVGKLFKSK